MKKIKLYCYRNKDTNSIVQRTAPFSDSILSYHEFLGTKDIELDEPPKEEPKRIEVWIDTDKFYKETKAHEKREEKQEIQLRNSVYTLERELKKHEKEPMNKAHPMPKKK